MKSAGKIEQNRGLEKDENSEKFSLMNEYSIWTSNYSFYEVFVIIERIENLFFFVNFYWELTNIFKIFRKIQKPRRNI